MAEIVPLEGLLPRRARSRAALERSLLKRVGRAIADYALVQAGDRIMVCVSGGKDSWALLDLLLALKRRAPVAFHLLAVNVDQGWPGYGTDRIAAGLGAMGVEFHMVADHFAPIVEKHIAPGETPCSLCSRLRRGVLYNLAVRFRCNKIALGHHRDDLIETLILNLFHSGKLASMPPLLRSDDGRNTVIRPLAYVPETWLTEYATERGFPIVSCGCPSCGLPEQQRQVVKRLLADLEIRHPGLKDHMLAALRNVKPSHLLDRTLWNRSADSEDSHGPNI
jgi:tRNA 2-thiocytidine biosynthesis protein TtcA